MSGRLPPIFHHAGAIARLRALAQHPPGSYEPNVGARVYGSALVPPAPYGVTSYGADVASDVLSGIRCDLA